LLFQYQSHGIVGCNHGLPAPVQSGHIPRCDAAIGKSKAEFNSLQNTQIHPIVDMTIKWNTITTQKGTQTLHCLLYLQPKGHSAVTFSCGVCIDDVYAGGLKTGPIFKRFADMRNKRTRWIHCYLQYFVQFQCSLHGPEDAEIFIANLR